MGQIISLKGMAKQVFSFSVFVQLQLRVNAHYIFHKIQIAEGYPCLQRVDGDAAVSPKHIVHMQLPDALDRLFLKLRRRWGKVGVFIAEQLVADFPGQQHPDVGLLVDGLADQVHPHTGPDGGDIVSTQQRDHRLQRADHLLRRHIDLRVLAADIVRRLSGVFQINGVLTHADGKCADRLAGASLRHRAYQRGVQTAAEEEPDLGVRHQPLLDAGDQLFADDRAHGLYVIPAHLIDGSDVPVADKFPVLVIVSRREWHDLPAQTHQVFRLAGKDDGPGIVIAVVERADTDGVTGGDIAFRVPVVQDQRKFCVQHPEHLHTVLLIQREQDLAVGAALEGIALCPKRLPEPIKPVDLAVADYIAAAQPEGLHPLRLQAHDGQTVKAQQTLPCVHDPAVIRPSGEGPVKTLLEPRTVGVF